MRVERLAGRIMLLWGLRRWLAAIAAGALGALAMPPFNIIAVLFVSFPVLVWLLDGAAGGPESGALKRLGAAFLLGWCFGFGYFTAGLWWLGNAFLLEAEEFAWALPLATLGLPAVLGLYYGLATFIARLLWSDGAGRLAALALGFGLTEWLRAFLFTGFPWNAIGYGLMPVPVMMQAVSLAGLHGMTIVAVLIFSAPALFGTGRGVKAGVGLALLLLAAQFGYGFWSLSRPEADEGRKLTFRLVQPAIDQSVKLEGGDRAAIFREHLRLSALPPEEGAPRPDVIVWPETSIPFILTENTDALAAIADMLEEGQILLTGAVRMEGAGVGYAPRYYNSVYAIDSDGQIFAAADKVHLTPFGEYVPFEDILRDFGVASMIALPGGFSAAAKRTKIALPDGAGLYPLICYEIIFPDEMEGVESGVNALLNVTNDAWFGLTPGPWQHFRQAQIRAVETGLPLIRAANNGVSAVVDGKGRVLAGLTLGARGKVDATLNIDVHPSPFLPWRKTNFWLIVLAAAFYAVLPRRRFIFWEN